ncbi:MAG: hypothetical protein AB8W35_03640 [Coxiella endosymbiont of Dermacentor nuttalli]
MIMQLKDLKEADLNRMGIDTKHIDMRKVDPVYIELPSLKNNQIDSPLRHAEKALESLNQNLRNRIMPKDELEELKAERAKLEANVEEKNKNMLSNSQNRNKKINNGKNKNQALAFKFFLEWYCSRRYKNKYHH